MRATYLISNAIRGNTQKWLVKGDGYKDPTVFLESTAPAVERLINSINSQLDLCNHYHYSFF